MTAPLGSNLQESNQEGQRNSEINLRGLFKIHQTHNHGSSRHTQAPLEPGKQQSQSSQGAQDFSSIHQNTQVLCWQWSHCDFSCTIPQTMPIKDVMSCDIWQVTITPLMCGQQQQKALIPAYLDFSNRNVVHTPVNGTIPSLLIRLCLQETPMVSFWFYQNTHGDNLVEVKHCEMFCLTRRYN